MFILLATPVLIYLVLVLVACGVQRAMLFPVPRPARMPVAPGLTLLHVESPASHTVAFFARARGDEPTIVFFHGNGEQLADDADLLQSFVARGFGVFAVEYPGYGVASGEPTETTILGAARAALDRLHGALGVGRDRTVIVGQSLGTGVAVAMAAEQRCARLVLLSPYTSIGDVAQAALPWLPARWLVLDRFDSYARAPSVTSPTLVVHGDHDEVIPFALGQRLATRLHARFLACAGRHHNDLWSAFGDERPLIDEIAAFARE